MAAIVGVVVLLTLITSGGGRPTRAVSNSVRRGSTNPTAKGRTPASDSLLKRENVAIDRLLSRQSFITSGGGQRREIALTFDDGPGPYTPRLLDQLQRLHAPATFFEVGFMISYFQPSLQRELRIGMVIGDHTELHPMMARLTQAAQEREILLQTDRLANTAPRSHACTDPHTAHSTRRHSESCTSCTC